MLRLFVLLKTKPLHFFLLLAVLQPLKLAAVVYNLYRSVLNAVNVICCSKHL